MEWSLYPELGQTLGSSNQGLALFNIDPAGTMGASPDGSDESGFLLGTTASELSGLLADSAPPSLGSLSDILAWESWDVGSFGTDAMAATTPPSDSEAMPMNNGIPVNGNIGTDPSSVVDNPTRRCPNPNNTCLTAVASAISAVHTSADMCLSSFSSPSFSPSSSRSGNSASTTNNNNSHQPHHPGPPTLDAVLTSNREARRAISAALECSVCSSQPQLHLLVATALEKLAGWYRAVAEGLRARGAALASASTASLYPLPSTRPKPTTKPPSTRHTQPPPSPPPSSTATATTTTTTTTTNKPHHQKATLPPIAIGSHAILDETLQAAVVAQVVLQRLRELRGLLELLARRMAGTGAGEEEKEKEEKAPLPPHSTRLSVLMPEAVREGLVGRVQRCLVVAGEEVGRVVGVGVGRGRWEMDGGLCWGER